MREPLFEPLAGAAEPWTRLAALRLLEAPETEIRAAETALIGDRRVTGLLAELDPWPPTRRAKGVLVPGEAFWKLSVLADFGVPVADPRVARLADALEESQAADGTFRHGGSEHAATYDERGYICVTHIATYALARFGRATSPVVARATESLAAAVRWDGGWRPSGPTGAKAAERHARSEPSRFCVPSPPFAPPAAPCRKAASSVPWRVCS